MGIKTALFFMSLLVFVSCSEEEKTSVDFENLQEYITENNKDLELGSVIACAASEENNDSVSFIFYYPEETATNIQYFETENTSVDKDNFDLYTRIDLETEDVFNGYLERFIRNGDAETWCIVTYETEEVLHVSNPIRLKNNSKPTEWSSTVVINNETSLMPIFSWEDGLISENAIYFQVLSSVNGDFISGTYTFDKWFQFYELDNVVLNINNERTPVLNLEEQYNFTLMGVSEDNWVNLVVQKSFIAE